MAHSVLHANGDHWIKHASLPRHYASNMPNIRLDHFSVI